MKVLSAITKLDSFALYSLQSRTLGFRIPRRRHSLMRKLVVLVGQSSRSGTSQGGDAGQSSGNGCGALSPAVAERATSTELAATAAEVDSGPCHAWIKCRNPKIAAVRRERAPGWNR
jgi:hypothetical protein